MARMNKLCSLLFLITLFVFHGSVAYGQMVKPIEPDKTSSPTQRPKQTPSQQPQQQPANPTHRLTAADSARALELLSRDIEKLVYLPREKAKGDVGIMVALADNGLSVFELDPDKALTPASTTKLVTAYTALQELGPDYVIRTLVAADKKPVKGVINGNLYIKGHGDPFLSVDDIDELIGLLKEAGITRINGNIIGDGSFFDNVYERLDYSGDDDVVVDLPPVSALSIERNIVTVVVSATRTAGQKCNVQTFPPSAAFIIENTTKSYAASGRSRRRKSSANEQQYGSLSPQLDRSTARYGDESPLAYPMYHDILPKPEEARVKIRVMDDSNGIQTIRVSGTLKTNSTVSDRFEIRNPPLVIAGMLYDRLRTHEIEITGTIDTGVMPDSAAIITSVDRPLVQVLEPMMKHSNNYYAEYIFKIIGAAAGGQKGTAKHSVQKIQKQMDLGNIPFSQCVLNDGSGLSRRNCLSAAALTTILCTARHDSAIFHPFYSSMSVAGEDGTLRKRMKGTTAQGNVHGKTGTLRNVSALAGYVTSADGNLFAFATLMNGFDHGNYKSVQDKIAERLARFSFDEGRSTGNAGK